MTQALWVRTKAGRRGGIGDALTYAMALASGGLFADALRLLDEIRRRHPADVRVRTTSKCYWVISRHRPGLIAGEGCAGNSGFRSPDGLGN
jgi:hypothetical protein